MYYDVKLAVKAGAEVIVLDGMQGGTAVTQEVSSVFQLTFAIITPALIVGGLAASGALAGLVGITPACAYVSPLGALACLLAVTRLKRALGYDDSLDVFGLHGVGGMVGALLTGPFASPSLGGYVDGVDPLAQAWIQLQGVAFTFVYCLLVSGAILGLIKLSIGLRTSVENEQQGLDLAEHDERAYNS